MVHTGLLICARANTKETGRSTQMEINEHMKHTLALVIVHTHTLTFQAHNILNDLVVAMLCAHCALRRLYTCNHHDMSVNLLAANRSNHSLVKGGQIRLLCNLSAVA